MAKFKLDHVKLSLLLYIFYVVTVPHIDALGSYAVPITVGFLLILCAIAARVKAWVDVVIMLLLAAVFFFARLKFSVVDPPTYVLRTTSTMAILFFHFTLLIGPWTRLVPAFRDFYKHRRHFGVTTFLLAFTHASFIYNYYFDYSLKTAYQAVFVFFGSTALFILFFMAVTSWDYVQKHVTNRWWKIIHTVVFLMYAGFVLYFWKLSGDTLVLWEKTLIVLFLIFWLTVAPWTFPRLILRRVNGWKQLHVLVYAAYASVIAHVWTGTVSGMQTWLQTLFWFLFSFVVGSHMIGWVKMFEDYLRRKRQARASAVDTITLDGVTYRYLDSADTFTEGSGRRFDVEGIPLAIYKHEGGFFGMSQLCPHQGGPIADGAIVNGYVECPWHHYQFGVKDGLGPPGFKDCIPYYLVVERDGKVYVSLEKVKNKDYQCDLRDE